MINTKNAKTVTLVDMQCVCGEDFEPIDTLVEVKDNYLWCFVVVECQFCGNKHRVEKDYILGDCDWESEPK